MVDILSDLEDIGGAVVDAIDTAGEAVQQSVGAVARKVGLEKPVEGFLGNLGRTVRSLGGASIAPAGLAWDVVTAPFDDDDDEFGKMVSAFGTQATAIASPANALTGGLAPDLLKHAAFLTHETVQILGTPVNLATHIDNTGDDSTWFSGEAWAKAYDVAEYNTFGKAMVGGIENNDMDPFDDPIVSKDEAGNIMGLEAPGYAAYKKDHPILAPALAHGTEFALLWYVDPLVIAGKAAATANAARKLGKVKVADREIGMVKQMDPATSTNKRLASNTQKLTGFQDEAGKWTPSRLKGLSTHEITRLVDNLAHHPQGDAIASQLAIASRIEDPARSAEAIRHQLAIGAGDPSGLAALASRGKLEAQMADALDNLASRDVTGDVNQAVSEILQPLMAAHGKALPLHNTMPEVLVNAQRQIDNIPAIEKWLMQEQARTDLLIDIGKSSEGISKSVWKAGGVKSGTPTMRVSSAGERALARDQGQGLFRNARANTGFSGFNKGLDATLGKGARLIRYADESIYQASPLNKSLRVVHSLVLKPILGPGHFVVTGGVKLVDALRLARPTGVAILDDKVNVTRNIEAYLRRGGVDAETSDRIMTQALATRTGAYGNQARKALTDQAIEASSLAIKAKWTAKTGTLVDDDFMRHLIRRGIIAKDSVFAPLNGAVYSATKRVGRDPKTGKKTELKIDEFVGDNGELIRSPVLGTEGQTLVAMPDIILLEKGLQRYGGRMATVGRAWKIEGRERGLAAASKGGMGSAIDRGLITKYQVTENAISVLEVLNRWWKFTTLLRMGYPLRITADDQQRGMSAVGALANTVRPTSEWLHNMPHNLIGRRKEAYQLKAQLQTEREDLLTFLKDGNLVHQANKDVAELARLDRAIAKAEGTPPSPVGTDTEIAELVARRDELTAVADRTPAQMVELKNLRLRVTAAETPAKLKADLDDLVARRQMIADAGYHDPELDKIRVAQIEAQLDGLHPILRPKAAGAPKQRIGEKERARRGKARSFVLGDDAAKGLDEDILIPDLYHGVHGPVMRRLVAGETMPRLVEGAEGRLYDMQRQLGDWIEYTNDMPGHLHAWERQLNAHLRVSPLSRGFIEGKSYDDMVRWLRSTPEGRAMRDGFPMHGRNPEEWAANVERMVDEYVPLALRKSLLKREVTAKELGAMFPQGIRPKVHGASLDVNLGTGPLSGFGNRLMKKFYEGVAQKMSANMGRSPLAIAFYRGRADELIEARRARYKAEGKKFTQDDMNDIHRTAQQYALREVNRTLFDLGGTTNMTHTLRFASPFFAAHVESLNRWWRLVSNDPSIVRRFYSVFELPRNAGIVVDSETGEPVRAGEPIEANHVIAMSLPKGVGPEWLNALSQGKEFSEASVNLVWQGGGPLNPGFGPLFQIPAGVAAKKWNDEKWFTDTMMKISPFGPQEGVLDPIIPSQIQRLYAASKSDSQERHMLEMTILRDDMVQFTIDNDRPPNRKETRQLVAAAEDKAGNLAVLRAASAFVSPVAVQPRSRFEWVLRANRKLQEEGRLKHPDDYMWADRMTLKKYGHEFFALLQSTSNTVPGITASVEGSRAYAHHKDLLQATDPLVHRAIIADEGSGAFDPNVWMWMKGQQAGPGSEGKLTEQFEPAEWMKSTLESQGWAQYNKITEKYMAEAAQMGYTSYEDVPSLALAKREATEKLIAENPTWSDDYKNFDAAKFDIALDSLKDVAKNETLLNDTARTDIRTLAQYLHLRRVTTSAIAQAEAMGQDTAYIRSEFTGQVWGLVESNTFFQTYHFNGLLDRDPLLVDNYSVGV